jgi:hypothetical protein
MTKIDAYKYILQIWVDPDRGPDDFNGTLIMLWLVMLGFPCTRAGVLKVARAYCDSQSENRLLRARR